MDLKQFVALVLECAYVFIGLIFFVTALAALLSDSKKKLGTAAFWIILGLTFAFGSVLPSFVVGLLLILVAVLTATKQVELTIKNTVSDEEKERRAKKYGLRVFVPSVVLAFVAVGLTYTTKLGGLASLVFGAIAAILVSLIIFKPKMHEVYEGTAGLTQQMGTSIVLPQLLAALGAVFTAAKVGDVISTGVASVVPAENRLLGIVAYVLGMVIFTMIMGNAFAAFTVITSGIGVPFVFALGANPIIAGTLAMTAGYCGTLLTPMAANFNSMPAALLEMDDPNGVIKAQAPIALTMIVVHIVLMYFLAY